MTGNLNFGKIIRKIDEEYLDFVSDTGINSTVDTLCSGKYIKFDCDRDIIFTRSSVQQVQNHRSMVGWIRINFDHHKVTHSSRLVGLVTLVGLDQGKCVE